MEILRVGVGIAACWAAAGLLVAWRGSKAFGVKRYAARAAGDARHGVLYAFGAGMLPPAKESVRTHMGAWAAGVIFHGGTFAAVVLLALTLLAVPPPGWLGLALGSAALLGAACGGGLLLKRTLSPHLRSFSTPDDYLSNGLTTGFGILAGLAPLGLLSPDAALAAAIALLLYIPLGKIRHCLFFFPTRFHFGTFFGRRGVLPPGRGGSRA